MARLIWTGQALNDLAAIRAYIAEHNPVAAAGVAARIALATARIAEMPLIGRHGKVAGTREWPVRRTPYLVIYRVAADEVEITTVRHSARRWPPGI